MEKIQELLCDLLYEREISEIKEFISKTDDAVLLHIPLHSLYHVKRHMSKKL